METVTYETRRRPPLPVRILATAVITFVGIWLAGLLDLVSYDDSFWTLLFAALVLAAINVIIKPVMMLLSLPFIIVTLGLFIVIVNAFMLWITELIVPDFVIDGFWNTVGAALIVSIANLLLGGLMRDFTEKPKRETYEVI